MSAESVPDPQALLSELEGAFSQFDESRIRLHNALAGAAQGLQLLGDRVARLEADLETAKNHLAHTRTEGGAERDQQAMKIAALEGEIAALKQAHQSSSTEAAERSSAAITYNQKIGELEGTVAALTEHVTKLALERDAHGQHAATVEAELLATRQALEAEIAAIGHDHDRAVSESDDRASAVQSNASAKIAELELTVASVTEHASQLVEERDAQAKRAAVVEDELASVREALARRPGLDYVAAVEKQKSRAEEELAQARVDLDRVKRELTGVRERLTKSTSSTRILLPTPLPQTPPVQPEAKAFAQSSVKSGEKPPGALNVDELLLRAKAVKNPSA